MDLPESTGSQSTPLNTQSTVEEVTPETAGATTGSESQQPNEVRVIGTECYSWVQKHRKGQCTYDDALAAITKTIIGSSYDARTVGNSLRNYQLMLDTARTLASTTRDTAEDERVVDKTLGPPTGSAQAATGSSDVGRRRDGRTRRRLGVNPNKEALPHSNRDLSESSSESDDDLSASSESTAAKRQRLDSECDSSTATKTDESYPWESFHRCAESLSIEQRRTKSLLDKWNMSDSAFKRAFKNLLRAPGLPRFPRSQLKNMLAGEFVDLDKVYSSVNSLMAESNIRAKINDSLSIELEGELTSARQVSGRVCDQASYTVATNLLLTAMLFVFGDYRREELAAYFTHVQTMFSSLAPAHHSCVINYDKAVRLLIAQSNDVAFNDFTKFVHLERANLHPLGVNVAVDFSLQRGAKDRPSLAKRRSQRPVEICRNFNSGRCMRTASECTYRHICSTCHKPGHASKDNKCIEGSKPASAAKTSAQA